MTFYFLDRAIREAPRSAEKERRWELFDAQQRAIKLMVESVEGDLRLGAVQGPPGTGKTSVVEAFAKDKLADFMVSESKDFIVYVAPTNHLVFEAFLRVSAQLMKAGYDIRSLTKSLRVYGSRIRPFRDKAIKIEGITADEIQQLVGDIDHDVRIIFATEFQRISTRLSSVKPGRIHIVADEASKSPFFRIFLPLAEKIAREPEEYYPYSLLVLGDPNQAITVPEEYREMRVPLLMGLVKSILREKNWLDDYWIMLDTTFRLPSPSENPISYGFYDGRLIARYFAQERMKVVKEALLDNIDKIRRKLKEAGIMGGFPLEKILGGIEEAVSTYSPIIVINTQQPFRSGDTFDPERVKFATLVATIFQAAAVESNFSYSVAVTAPYCDIVDSVAFKFRKAGLPRPAATTVQSIIGGEADIIVAPLGKEWATSSPDDLMTTIYYKEPEILNVQLSRHKSVLALIGDINRMERARNSKVKRTIQKLKEMRNQGVIFIDV